MNRGADEPPPVDPTRKAGDGATTLDVKQRAMLSILDRMKRVNPDEAKRYRQKSGQ